MGIMHLFLLCFSCNHLAFLVSEHNGVDLDFLEAIPPKDGDVVHSFDLLHGVFTSHIGSTVLH